MNISPAVYFTHFISLIHSSVRIGLRKERDCAAVVSLQQNDAGERNIRWLVGVYPCAPQVRAPPCRFGTLPHGGRFS